jgi:chemotaxis protein methyltransferase CheR
MSALPSALLSELSKLIETEMGLYYPAKSWGELERRVAAAVRALGMADVESCIHQLLSARLSRRQIEILARHLTVSETYFFRDKGCFDVLEEYIFPELMSACERSQRQLRIWSAGCCTGEEPYSIAILLDRLSDRVGHRAVGASATIFATDVNAVFLEKAVSGLYGEWSFRATPAWIKERYFERRKNGQLEILPRIRKRVTFSYLNLAEESYPGIFNGAKAMDLILCRNVLMYFNTDRVTKTGQNFYRSLTDEGWLILSPAEMVGNLFSQFKQITFSAGILFRKTKIAGPEVAAVKYLASIPDAERNGITATKTLPQTSPAHGEKALFFSEGAETKHLLKKGAALPVQAAEPRHAIVLEDKEKFETLCDTAHSYANSGKLTEAVSWCEKAIAADKLNPAAHYLLATIFQELGHSKKAQQSLRQTLYLNPDFVLAHFTLGNLCMAHHQYREAERHFDNALTLLCQQPNDELLPESNGLTAGRVRDIITSIRSAILPGPQKREVQ